MLTLEKVNIDKYSLDWNGLPRRFFNEGELETLVTLARMVNPKVCVEFGINTGRTAKSILREVTGIEKYIGVDVLPGYVTEMKVQRGEVPQVAGELVKEDPRVQLIVTKDGSHGMDGSELPDGIDFVFIDGDHSRKGVEKDYSLVINKMKKGGIIVFHDYHDMGNVDVRDVLHDFADQGKLIKHCEGTWLAYELV